MRVAAEGPRLAAGRVYAYGDTTMYAVDGATGELVESFGDGGRLQILNEALQFKYPDTFPPDLDPVSIGFRLVTPPVYFENTLYTGAAVSEGHIPGGLVIANDATTGAIKWVFNTVPQGPSDDGWEIVKDTWGSGARAGGGIWTPPAIDPELGLIYFNAGNPSPDYDGSARHGMNLFTNATIALDLETGELAWYYQTVHHDLVGLGSRDRSGAVRCPAGQRADPQGRRRGRQELSAVSVAPGDRRTDSPDGGNRCPDGDRRTGRAGVADPTDTVHGEGCADDALLCDVSVGRRPGAGGARTTDVHALLHRRTLRRGPRWVELGTTGVQSADRAAVRDREERGHLVHRQPRG